MLYPLFHLIGVKKNVWFVYCVPCVHKIVITCATYCCIMHYKNLYHSRHGIPSILTVLDPVIATVNCDDSTEDYITFVEIF